MCFGRKISVLLLAVVAVCLTGCESSDDSSGAYWNQQGDKATQEVSTSEGSASEGTTTTSTSSAGDAISPGSINFLHASVGGWPVTSSLRVSISGGTISMPYDKANVWPAVGGLNANPWIIVNVNGQWTAGTFEWLRKGQTSKPTAVVEGGHIKVAPLNNFRPVSGETYGFMVTSLARDAKRTVNERTNIVLARWP